MCSLAAFAGLALSIGSTAANMSAQRSVQQARDDVVAAERIRQNSYDREAQGLNARSQNRYQGFDDKQEAKGKKLGDYFAQQAAAPNQQASAATLPVSSSDVVTREIADKSAQARQFTNNQAAQLGDLRSFGDLLGDVSRLQARDATQVGIVGGFKRGSSSVVPYELDAASHAADGTKFLADVLSGLGGVATSAITGKKKPPPAPTVNPVGTPAPAGSMALGGALDRASVPGYAGVTLYPRRQQLA